MRHEEAVEFCAAGASREEEDDEVLTWCVMSNHFHLLIRVPERPDRFSPDWQEVMALLEPAVGKEWSAALHRQWEIFGNNGCEETIDQWRQRMVDRMFSLSELVSEVAQAAVHPVVHPEDRAGRDAVGGAVP